MRSPRLHNHTPAPAGLRRWLTGLVLLLATLGSRAQAPDHTPAYYVERIENYVQVNAWQEAKRVIDEGLNEYSDDPNLRYYNGRYFYVAGRLNDARYNLTRAIQTDEMHFRAKRLLVDVEDGLKHYSSAICYLNELLEFQPYDRDMWRRKIALYRKIGNQVEADNALQRLAHIYPNDTIVARELRNHHRETWSDVLLRGTNAEAAINLEQWIDKDPENLEYYVELTNVYERMGEYDHALGTANRGLVHFPGNAVLINKIIGLMTARGLYHQALAFARQHNVSHLYNDLLGEIASQARMNDPYEANGRLYAATHDRDALNYLINTSLTRGYYDDARVYLGDAMKRDGRTAALLMKLYTLEQKSGNEQAAIKVLEELYQRQPDDEELIEQYAALMLRLGSSEMEGEQWHDARQHLARALELMTPEQETWPATVSRQITVLCHLGLLDEARRLYRDAAAQASPENARRFASAYEDIVANRLRLLVEEQNYETALRQAQALLEAVPGSDVALRCCINMSQTLRRDRLFWDYALQGYDTHPDDPYFIVKHALALQQQKRNAEALELLRPHLVAGDWTNPQLTTAHSGLADEWANELIKNHMPDLALTVLDSALVHDPNNKELLYTKGVAYEHLKEFAKAFELQNRNYEPSNAEQQEWYEHMRYLRSSDLRLQEPHRRLLHHRLLRHQERQHRLHRPPLLHCLHRLQPALAPRHLHRTGQLQGHRRLSHREHGDRRRRDCRNQRRRVGRRGPRVHGTVGAHLQPPLERNGQSGLVHPLLQQVRSQPIGQLCSPPRLDTHAEGGLPPHARDLPLPRRRTGAAHPAGETQPLHHHPLGGEGLGTHQTQRQP